MQLARITTGHEHELGVGDIQRLASAPGFH